MGRVTCGLAKAFARVHGYDISPSHLALAREHAAEIDVGNITFHLCSEDVTSRPLEECDFFYSKIVFQHNPPPLIRELIAASFRSLRPGGIAIFQVPTYGSDYNFSIKDYLARGSAPDMEMHCIPQPEVFSLAAAAACQVVEVREDGAVGWRGQWISDTFIVQRPQLDKATTSAPYHRK
jgi:SAM-dependent methyltransferase